MKRPSKARALGRYIVSDPKICHGKLTFRGTRIFVTDVLDQVAAGMAWESIMEEWNRGISKEAIREAIELANQALVRHADDFILEPLSA